MVTISHHPPWRRPFGHRHGWCGAASWLSFLNIWDDLMEQKPWTSLILYDLMRHVMEYEWDISWNHIPGVAEDEGFCSVPKHVLLLIIKKAYDHPQTQTLRIVHTIWRVLLPWRQTYGQMNGMILLLSTSWIISMVLQYFYLFKFEWPHVESWSVYKGNSPNIADFFRFVNGLEFALIYLHLDHVWGFYVARHM